MLSAATAVHAATSGGGSSGGDGTWRGAWTAIMPDAFQFDRRGAAPPPAHTMPDAALSPAGGPQAAYASSSGSGGTSAGRGTWGSGLRDGSGGSSGPSPRGLSLVPDAYADAESGLAAAPVLRHDRWALGEGLAPGDAYAYLVCGVPAAPPACFEATLAVVGRGEAEPVPGSVYSPAVSPAPWHIKVTIRDLIGYYVRDGTAFRMSDYQAAGSYDADMRTLRKAAVFDGGGPPAPWSFDLRFAGVRYEPRPVDPDPNAMRYAGALADTVFLLGGKIAVEMGPYNDRRPVLEDGEQWPNSVGAAVHVRESVPGYDHDYLYGPVDIRGGDPGSGRAIHRVSYTGDEVHMADIVVADGLPFPLSGGVRDGVLPAHFAADPHVDTRWWFRLVAASSEEVAARALGLPAGMSGYGAVDGRGGGDRGGDGAVPGRPTPPSSTTAIADPSAPGAGVPASPTSLPAGAGAAGSEEPPASSDSAPAAPPINIPRISGLLNDPAGLYDYLAELAQEMAALGAGANAGAGGDYLPTRDGPALTVSTDRTSYARGQPIAISGMSRADVAGGSGANPFVMISITGPGGARVSSLPAPVGTPLTGSAASPYTASIDTAEWDATTVPAGSMTVIAVHGTETATAEFELFDDGRGGNASASLPLPRPSNTTTGAASTNPAPPRAPLTVTAADVAYRHGDTATLSGTATRPVLTDPIVLLSLAGPGGAALASLTTHIGLDGRYSRDVPTRDWPVGPAGYGTVDVVAVRGLDTATSTFELLPPSPEPGGATVPPIPESAFPDLPPGVDISALANYTAVGTLPGTSPSSDADIGSAGIRSHVRYMIDGGNRTVGDLIVHDNSIVVYLGAAPLEQPPTTPTLWLRIPRTVMDPPDLDGDGRAFDVRIDGAASSHTEASDSIHHTLSVPVLHTTGIVEVSGPVAAALHDDSGHMGGGPPPPSPVAPSPPPPDPSPSAAPPQCAGSARCLRATITSVASADAVMLSGGISVRLALVSVPAPLEAGGEQARRLVASICPVGTQLVVDEDDLGASASSTTFRGRIVAEAYCNGGTVSIQDVLVASGLGTIDRAQCQTSEFAARPWAAGACGAGEEEG